MSNGRKLLFLMGKTDKMDNFKAEGEDIGNIDLVHNSHFEKNNLAFPTTNQKFVENLIEFLISYFFLD